MTKKKKSEVRVPNAEVGKFKFKSSGSAERNHSAFDIPQSALKELPTEN